MNRLSKGHRTLSTDQLHAAFGDIGGQARPDYLPDIVAQAGRMRQRRAWTLLARWLAVDIAVRRQGVARVAVLFAALSLLVALLVASVAFIGSQRPQSDRQPGLPTTPDAWERVLIETPWVTGSVVSLAATPHRLLAVVEDYPPDEAGRLVVSTDGRNWTVVPDGQHPALRGAGGGSGAALVGTDRGFLLLVGAEISYSRTIRPTVTPSVWASEDGFEWQRLASAADDPALAAGRMHVAVTAGPGLVGVGSDNKAWYSTDGSDWALAQVPPPPTAAFEQEGYPSPTVVMRGVAAADDEIVAWGLAYADNGASRMLVPVMWASSDGRTWDDVSTLDMSVDAAAGGPAGFVAAARASDVGNPADAKAWLSADGRSWEAVAANAFTAGDVEPPRTEVSSAAATSAGYVAVGVDDACNLPSCPSAEAVIWTSADGRSWSRLVSGELLTVTEPRDPAYTDGARTRMVVAWGSRFVVGGSYGGRPGIWISGLEPPHGGSAP